MANCIPINHDVLIWARKTAGFAQEDMLKSFPRYTEWEAGKSNPTYNQLDNLASKFHRPVAVFFFPEIPKEDSIEKSLRAMNEEDIEHFTPTVRFLFRKAKVFQICLGELYEGQIEEQIKKISWLNMHNNNQSIPELANEVRKYFNISIDEQSSWKNSEEALNKWRDVLARKGIFVFKESFKNDFVSGFCIYDAVFPIIFINNSLSKNRQIFTMFHELAHLLFAESYLDVFDSGFWRLEYENPNHIEVKCNAFAGEFLIPDKVFIESISTDSDIDENIKNLAGRFNVSKEVILRKFLNKKYIDRVFYEQKIDQWSKKRQKQQKESKVGGNYFNTKLAYLGDNYLDVVFTKYNQGKITLEQASEYLDIKVKSFSGIEDSFLGKAR